MPPLPDDALSGDHRSGGRRLLDHLAPDELPRLLASSVGARGVVRAPGLEMTIRINRRQLDTHTLRETAELTLLTREPGAGALRRWLPIFEAAADAAGRVVYVEGVEAPRFIAFWQHRGYHRIGADLWRAPPSMLPRAADPLSVFGALPAELDAPGPPDARIAHARAQLEALAAGAGDPAWAATAIRQLAAETTRLGEIVHDLATQLAFANRQLSRRRATEARTTPSLNPREAVASLAQLGCRISGLSWEIPGIGGARHKDDDLWKVWWYRHDHVERLTHTPEGWQLWLASYQIRLAPEQDLADIVGAIEMLDWWLLHSKALGHHIAALNAIARDQIHAPRLFAANVISGTPVEEARALDVEWANAGASVDEASALDAERAKDP